MQHSSPTVWRSKLILGVTPSNTHEFQCFHTSHSQNTKMMNEFSPLSISLGTPLIAFFHQLEKWTFVVKGATTSKFSHCRIKNHTCWVKKTHKMVKKTHKMSNCWIVSPIQSKIIDAFDLWFPSCKFNHYFIGECSCNIYGSAFKTNLQMFFFFFVPKLNFVKAIDGPESKAWLDFGQSVWVFVTGGSSITDQCWLAPHTRGHLQELAKLTTTNHHYRSLSNLPLPMTCWTLLCEEIRMFLLSCMSSCCYKAVSVAYQDDIFLICMSLL